jgi:hypothetical protein
MNLLTKPLSYWMPIMLGLQNIQTDNLKIFQTTHTASSSFPQNMKVFSQACTEQQNTLMQVNHLDTTVFAKSTKEST